MSTLYKLSIRIGSTELPVAVGDDWLEINTVLNNVRPRGTVPVVADENVARLGYAEQVKLAMEQSGYAAEVTVLSAGEGSKAYSTVERLHADWAERRVPRDGVVFAVGGGVVSDVAGFAAATWLRGIRWICCPTTVEAMVDACIGGKTGINLPCGKNLVGAFHQPSAVLVNVDTLRTLPRRDLVAGMAESIKHAAVHDAGLFEWHTAQRSAILQSNPEVLAELVVRNIRVKAEVIGPDERDLTGRRIILNFGHTVGHAIESAVDYRLRHGECVALGMVAAADLSRQLAGLSAGEADRLVRLLAAFELPVRLPEPVAVDRILEHLRQDKKTRDHRLPFVLLEAIGRARVVEHVDEARLGAAIASLT
ncbi:MAG TPA: 3-dehydroquinate synthase [Phycisphaerae bacterium]